MIYDIKLTSLVDRNSIVINHINEQKKINGEFSVIDVGGSKGGWSYPYVNAIVDLNAPTDGGSIKHFPFNISYPDGWKDVEDHVKENGKFDFSICSHTLEDISNPKYVCQQLSKISKSGYVAVPSKYDEFSRFLCSPEGKFMRGYIHHRWIFIFKNGEFTGFPKITYVEVDDIFNKLAKSNVEYLNLGFFWKDELCLHVINDDYLGPTVGHVMDLYRTELFNDDIDKLYGL